MPTREQLLELYRFVQRAVARHRDKGLKVFVVGAVLALAGAVFMPRSYYSEARLFVRFGRENQVAGQVDARQGSNQTGDRIVAHNTDDRKGLHRLFRKHGADR